MKIKAVEIRDRATFVPALAISINHAENPDLLTDALIAAAGFDLSSDIVFLLRLETAKCQWDPHSWGDRTFTTAHLYIQQNWEWISSGDVIDVEYILGETTNKKVSEVAYHI